MSLQAGPCLCRPLKRGVHLLLQCVTCTFVCANNAFMPLREIWAEFVRMLTGSSQQTRPCMGRPLNEAFYSCYFLPSAFCTYVFACYVSMPLLYVWMEFAPMVTGYFSAVRPPLSPRSSSPSFIGFQTMAMGQGSRRFALTSVIIMFVSYLFNTQVSGVSAG